MAGEDFLLRVGIDPKGMSEGVKRGVDDSLKEISRLQRAAAAQPDTRVAQLPQQARRDLANVSKVDTKNLKDQVDLQKKLIEDKAKLIALNQQEARVVARAGGQTVSKTQLSNIRAGGEEALARSLGMTGLTPQLKGQLTRRINQINKDIDSALAGLDGTQLQNKFRTVSNQILPTVGITDKARVTKASVVAQEFTAPVRDNTRTSKASNDEAAAAERAAKIAKEDADDAERSAKVNRSNRRREEVATAKRADAAEQSVSLLARGTQRRAETNSTILKSVADQLNETRSLPGGFENRLGTMVRSENLDSILRDGVKNFFESGTGAGSDAKDARLAVEQLWGIDPKDTNRPVYGMMDLPSKGAAGYGDVFVRLKESLDKVTMTIGDSGVPSDPADLLSLVDAQNADFNAPGMRRYQGEFDSMRDYMELQFHDAISADKIAGVDYRPRQIKANDFNKLKDVAKVANDQGFPLSVTPQLSNFTEEAITEFAILEKSVGALNKAGFNIDLTPFEESLKAFANEPTPFANVDSFTPEFAQQQAKDSEMKRQAALERTIPSYEQMLQEEYPKGFTPAQQLKDLSTNVEPPPQQDEPITLDTSDFDAAEQELIKALIRKREALDDQTLVLTSNYSDFAKAEEALIRALLDKTNALRQQADVVSPSTPGRPVSASEQISTPPPAVKPRAKKDDGLDLFEEESTTPAASNQRSAADDAEREAARLRQKNEAKLIRQTNAVESGDEAALTSTELKYFKALEQAERDKVAGAERAAELQQQEATILAQQLEENLKQLGIEKDLTNLLEVLRARVADNLLTAKAGNKILEQAGVIAPGESTVLNTAETRRLQQEREAKAAADRRARNNLPLSQRFNVAPITSPAGFLGGIEQFNDTKRGGLPRTVGELGLGKRPKDEDVFDAATEFAAKTMFDAALAMSIAFDGFEASIVQAKAQAEALGKRLSGAVKSAIVDDDFLREIYTQGAAENKVASRVLAAGTEAEIAGNPRLQRAILEAELELLGFKRREATEIAKRIAASPAELQSIVENITARTQQAAATRRATTADNQAADAAREKALADLAAKTQTRLGVVSSPEGQALLAEQGRIRELERAARAGQPDNAFARFSDSLGYRSAGSGSPLEFFGGGALASVRYGLPSMLLYGAGGGITNTIKEAEQLQVNLARLEGQFESTFGDDPSVDFSQVSDGILSVARDTGLAADEIANLQIQLTGAFGGGVEIGGLTGLDLIEEQVNSAAKLAQTVGLPLAEITDGLTAASLAFDASFERIGDVALGLEQESGVLARETISFIGDIAPVAEQAGFSLEEFSAIATVAQQRSGRSGTALAESFGRVIPAIAEQKDALLELASIEPALATNRFIDAIRNSDVKVILDEIGKSYENLSKTGQQSVVTLLGGRREAQAILPALTNQEQIASLVRTAENSADTLEERFSKIRETLTNQLQRLIEIFRQVGVELLESGLTDVLSNALNGVKLILNLLSPFLRLVTAINDAFAGWPIQILAAVVAFKALKSLLLVDAATNAGAAVGQTAAAAVAQRQVIVGTRGLRGGQGIAPPALGFGNGLGFRQNFTNQYRNVVNPQSFYTMGNRPPIGAGQPFRVPGGGTRPLTGFGVSGAAAATGGLVAKGAATGALAAIGGGSVGLGAAFAGVAALALLYTQVNNQIDQEQADLDKLRAEIDRGNEKVDLTIPEIKVRRIEDLRQQAAEAAEKGVGFWNKFTGDLTREQILLAEAYTLETTKGFDEAIKVFDLSEGLSADIFDKYGAKLGKNTGGLRDLAARYKVAVNDVGLAIGEDQDGALLLLDEAGRRNTDVTGLKIEGQDLQYIEDLAEKVGVDATELDFGFVEASLQKNSRTAILELAKGEDEAVKKYGQGAVDNAQAYVEAVFRIGKGDKGFEKLIDELIKDFSALPPLESNQLKLDQLKAGFDAGVIGIGEYSRRLIEGLRARREILRSTDQTEATELQILQVLQQEQQAYADFAQSIISQQEQSLEVQSILSGESELGQLAQVIENNSNNLSNPVFQSLPARRQAALNIIEAEKAVALEQAKRSGNLNEISKILSEGVGLSDQASQELYTQEVFQSDSWKKLAEDLEAVLNSSIETFTSTIPKNSLFGGLSSTDNKLFTAFGDTAQEVAQSIFQEYFSLGELSENTLGSLQGDMNDLLSSLNQKGITAEQREEILGSIDGLIDLLAFVGLPEDMLLDFLAGGNFEALPKPKQDKIRKELEDYLKNTPFGKQSKEQKANFDVSQGLDLISFSFRQQRRDAAGNSIAEAQADLDEANQDMKFLMEREAKGLYVSADDMEDARDAQAEAQRAMADANFALSSAQLNYFVTLNRLNGNFVAAIDVELEILRQEINKTKDPATKLQLQTRELELLDQRKKELLADQNAVSDAIVGVFELNGNIIAAAEESVKKARRDFDAAPEGSREKVEKFLALAQAQSALDDARGQVRDVFFAQFSAAAEPDPVRQAQIDLALAKEQQKAAKGIIAEGEARINVLNAQRQLQQAMNDARYSMYSLRQAELAAMGDEIGAAQVAAELAREQLNDAIAAGAGAAELNAARANLISADRAARDAVFQDRMDEYKWLLDMGQISRSQYINYLEGLKNTLIPGTRQFKDLELTIKQLKDDIGGDLQANLPTSLRLPTLYEVRRFNQSATAGMGGGIGYQDNRQVSVQVNVNGASPDVTNQVVAVIEDVMGVNRNGYGQRRY